MRVLHVIWHLGQGGAQTYLYNLLKLQIADADLQPRLLVLGKRGALSEDFEELLEVSYLDMRGGLDLLRAIRIPAALKRSDEELVHSHSNNLAFNFALQFFHLPVVYTEHGGGLLGGRRRDLLIYRHLSRAISRYIAISQEMAKVMKAANPSLEDRIDVVYNGVNIDAIAAIPVYDSRDLDSRIANARYRVGIVGRLEYQKGIDLFIESAAYLCKKRDDVVFIVIGDGSLRLQLEKHALEKGIAGRVFFLGYRTDALSLLKRLDVFLFTSNYEPFGLVITESMAAEVPVVATNSHGAVLEIISNGGDGLLVNGRNPQQIADVVDRLLSDVKLRSDIIRNARETVRQRFTIQASASGVRAVYLKCLQGRFVS